MSELLDELEEFFPHSVTVRKRTGIDGNGDPTYGASASYTCRIKMGQRLVRAFDGKERVSTLQVLFNADNEFGVKDEFTLPTRYVPNKPEALAVNNASDEDGEHHQRVSF